MEEKHNIDKFQGYPHYPASEDITRAANNNGKQRLDEETPLNPFNDTIDTRDKDSLIVEGTDADVTPEDLKILEATDQNMDSIDEINLQHAILDSTDTDGDPLNEDSRLPDLTGEGLDVPGSEADDENELIGEEDEENNYYSLGGDNHEAQEESK